MATADQPPSPLDPNWAFADVEIQRTGRMGDGR